jgi:hypothetical protein
MFTIKKPQMDQVNQSTQSSSGAVLACTVEFSPCPPTTKVTKAEEIAPLLEEGDIVLRMGPDGESRMIAESTRSKYSHSGIVVKGDDGKIMIVDAYPGDDRKGAVKPVTPEKFFGEGHAISGGVFRPKDKNAATKAASWAKEQTKDPDYVFDLSSPWNEDKKRVYCSDFVYQAFSNAGVTLVEDKYDLLSEDNRSNTAEALRKYKGGFAKVASDEKIAEQASAYSKSSEFIAPGQLADSPDVCPAVDFEPTAAPSAVQKGKGK